MTGSAAPGELGPVSCQRGMDVLSIDLEMWHDTSCVDETGFLLDVLEAHRARATFFVLGSVATREPGLVKRIAGCGHEIASHGWNHDQIWKKSPSQYRDEMQRSFDTLSGLVGSPIAGYRAPHFSVSPDTYWALDVLAEIGFKYDSSIFPIAGPRYGIPDFPRAPVRVKRNGRSIVEVPLSTVRQLRWNLPVAGGGYFRLLPYPIIERSVRAVHGDGRPFVVYCHPYEFRRESLVWPPGAGLLGRAEAVARGAKFNLFRRTMLGKLTRLLTEFTFTSVQEALRL